MSAGCRFGLFKGAVIRAVFICPYYKGPSSPGGQKAEGGTCPLMLKLQGLRPPGGVLTPSQESFLCSYAEGSVPGHLECTPGASTALQEDEPGPQVRILCLILRLRILTTGSLRSGFPTDSLFQKPTRFFVLSPVSLLSFNS